MILLNDLYTITDVKVDNEIINARVNINVGHIIFDGHFPNQPVLPGVCLLEMMKDIIASAYNQDYTIVEGNNIKYLAVVDPTNSPSLHFEISTAVNGGLLKVSAASTIESGEVNFKFKGQLLTNGK